MNGVFAIAAALQIAAIGAWAFFGALRADAAPWRSGTGAARTAIAAIGARREWPPF